MSKWIDADALWDKMQKFYTDGDCGDDDGYNLGINVGITKCHSLLTKVPSIDIYRPQGEWEDTGKDPDHSHPLTAIWYRCSECGDGTNTKTNYCPNCGAKMKQ